MKIALLAAICILFSSLGTPPQRDITRDDIEPFTIHFSLSKDYKIEGKAETFFHEAVGQNQFVGLAELHHSKQFSRFTTGFLQLLKAKGFDNFALEVGPYSAEILQKASKNPDDISASIKMLNRIYGKGLFQKMPIPFVNGDEDLVFLKKASELKYNYWGLDQEYSYSFEMHLDTLFTLIENGDEELLEYYRRSKEIVRKAIFRKSVDGQSKYCWILSEPTLNQFFEMCQSDIEAKEYVGALKMSLDIYCRSTSNKPSNQIRANYMKTNFDRRYDQAQSSKAPLPKVLVKLGSIHLTHGKSPFGVDDIGQHLSMKAKKNETGFLTIRHLKRFHRGRDLIGKNGWKGHEILMSLGKKDSWTAIDLRPIRKRLEDQELRAGEKLTFQIYSYDLVLIPPNDH